MDTRKILIMENAEIVNCYCFNPHCKSSIFAHEKTVVVRELLSRVLSEAIHCKDCGAELVSKPVLEIKSQLDSCVHEQTTTGEVTDNNDMFINAA